MDSMKVKCHMILIMGNSLPLQKNEGAINNNNLKLLSVLLLNKLLCTERTVILIREELFQGNIFELEKMYFTPYKPKKLSWLKKMLMYISLRSANMIQQFGFLSKPFLYCCLLVLLSFPFVTCWLGSNFTRYCIFPQGEHKHTLILVMQQFLSESVSTDRRSCS